MEELLWEFILKKNLEKEISNEVKKYIFKTIGKKVKKISVRKPREINLYVKKFHIL